MPSVETFEGWAEKTPDDFTFAAKCPKAIVHGGKTDRPDPGIILEPEHTYHIRDQFLNNISKLGKKLGPLLIQFPYFNKSVFADASEFYYKLNRFLTDLPAEFRYSVEIRNRWWLKPELMDICRHHRCALTLVDQAWMPMPDELSGKLNPVTTDFMYVRLLGDRKEIEAITKSWDKEVIDRGENIIRWAAYLNKLLEEQIRTYVFVNNHYAGHAPTTLKKLRELLENFPGFTR